MKQFNLTEWLQDKSRKVVTRTGKPVRIVCWDMKSISPIIGIIQDRLGGEFERNYALNGRYSPQNETEYDLFFADKEKTKKALMMNKEEALQQYEYEKQLFEQWGGTSIITFKEWLEIKSIVLSDKEEELTEFEKQLGVYIYFPKLSSGFNEEEKKYIKDATNTLISLARKELEKDIEYSAVEFAKSYMEDVNPSFEKVKESEELWKWKMSCLRGINKAYKQGKKDALKDLPKWKKTKDYIDPTIPVMYTNAASMKTYVEYNGYKLCINDVFEKLQKEE